MKLIDKKQNFVIEGLERRAFKIKASAKAFDILSSKLYSKPIEAIVRELSTNAVDAHIMAGNENTKYQVTLPTYNNPYFEIRDFGPGLSVDDVENIFTTVFESTKTDSNDVTGCLGLGSKSPFAYTDSYNVTSYYNGVVYYFSCFKDDYGIPNVAKFGEEETTEPNGLKISIAVNSGDCDSFIKAARKIYPYLMIKPDFVGYGLTLDEIIYEENDEWWGVCKHRPNDVSGLMVIMGGVAYPVANKIDGSDFNNFELSLINSNIDIKLNIGDVDIEAGREGLQFTKRTQNVIKHKFRHIVKYFTEKVQKSFDSCKTVWDVYCYSHDYRNNIGDNFVYHIFSKIEIEIDGKKIKPSTQYINVYGHNLYQFSTNRGVLKKYKCGQIRPSKKCVFINNDGTKASYSKTRYYQETNPDKVVYYLDSPTDKDAKKNLCQSIGINESMIVDTATLPKIKRNTTVTSSNNGSKKKTAAAVKYIPNKSPQYSWIDDTVDVYTKIYYVPIDRYTPICDSKPCPVDTVNIALSCLKIAGVNVPSNVYGLRKALIDKLAKDKKCQAINLFDFTKSAVEKFDATNDYTQKYIDYVNNNNILTYRESMLYKKIRLDEVDKNGIIYLFMTAFHKVERQKNNRDILTIRNFLSLFTAFSDKTPKTDLTKLKEEIILKYPLLEALDCYSVGEQDITDYINSIDKLKGV